MIEGYDITLEANDTKLINTATGENLSKTLAIEYGAQITIERETVVATCQLAMANLSVVVGKVDFVTLNPVSRKYDPVRAIEFRDGSRVEIAEDGTPSVVPPSIGGAQHRRRLWREVRSKTF
jgi:hypothetical protein